MHVGHTYYLYGIGCTENTGTYKYRNMRISAQQTRPGKPRIIVYKITLCCIT